ncbi:MAG: class I SAM-dependent methyltransferase [Deltaproteobacteria bacterium]|nr:class I SAM-dependent methyltransferase [Deltaproteobacteria bacterium]
MTASRERCPACPLCEAPGAADLGVGAPLPAPGAAPRWRRCGSGGSLFAWPPPPRDALAAHFAEMAYGDAERADAIARDKEPLFAHLLARLQEARPPGRRLLDVGCSFGAFLERARGAGFEPRGVEPNPQAVAVAGRRGFPVACAWGLADAGLAPDSVDVVTSIDALYYAESPLAEVRAAARALAPGGLLAIRTTNKAWLAWPAALARRLAPRAGRVFQAAVHDHLTSMPPRALGAALARAGFVDVVVEGGATTVPLERAAPSTRLAYHVSAALERATGGRVHLSPGVLVLARRGPAAAPDLASAAAPAL